MRRIRGALIGLLLVAGMAACTPHSGPPPTTTTATTTTLPPGICIGHDADGDWILTFPPYCVAPLGG